MSLQEEADIKSNHLSQEEVAPKEYCVNQKDLNGHEKMIESITDNQKSTEEADMKNVSVDNDLEVLASSLTECPRNLNGAYLKDGSNGEVDISSGFAVVTREYTPRACRNSRKPMRLPPRHEVRPDSPALHAEQLRFPNQKHKVVQNNCVLPIKHVRSLDLLD